MKKAFFLIPVVLFAVNKEFEKKYLLSVKTYKNEINQSKLLQQNVNIDKIQFDINKTLKKINFKKPSNKEAKIQAEEISNYLKSSKFQENVVNMKKYILYDKKIGFSKYLPKNYFFKLKKHNFLANDETIYVVISSSIPISTIQNYFQEVQPVRTDIIFVLRGFVGNNPKRIKPTLKWLNRILTKDPNKKPSKKNRYWVNVEINPKVTEHFNIKEVPAVIYVKNYNGFLDMYKPLPKRDMGEKAYIAYGDANLVYVFEKINQKAKSKTLEKLIKKMRGGFFN